MSSDSKSSTQQMITKSIQSHLEKEGLELVDLVAMPDGTDGVVRYQTMQEVLADFENASDEHSRTYILQIRKKREQIQKDQENHQSENIYLPNGELNSEHLLKNAHLLYCANDYASARNIYLALSKSGDRTAESLLGVARCYEAEGQLEKALRYYEDSILYYPNRETYRAFASLLIRTHRDQQAAEVLERALFLKDLTTQNRYDLHHAAGNAWLRAKNSKRAESHYRSALECHPYSDSVATNLGMLCLQDQRYDEAKTCFEESLRINPKNERAWYGKGCLALARNQVRDAYSAFVESLKIRIQQPQAILRLVKCAFELKDYAPARDLLKTYVEVSPFNANLLYSLAGLEFHLGEKLAALRTARTILQIQPKHPEATQLIQLIEKQNTF